MTPSTRVSRTRLELAVQDLAGIAVAAGLGVDRVELCSGLALGGLTPSDGLVQAAVDAGLDVHVLLRPRGGGFEYDLGERGLVVADAARLVERGAAGVVVGGTSGDRVDLSLVRAVVEAVGPAEVTFHRALDTVADVPRALDELAGAGVRRVLTSGGAARAVEALDRLRAAVQHSAGRVEVMAGGGVDAAAVPRLLATGVDALHASAKRAVPGPPGPSLGSAGHGHETTDPEAAARLLQAVRAASRPG